MSPLLSLTLSSLHFSNEVIHFHGHYDSNFNIKCHLKIRSSFCLAMHSSKWVRENTNVDSEGWKQKCKTILKLAVCFFVIFFGCGLSYTHIYMTFQVMNLLCHMLHLLTRFGLGRWFHSRYRWTLRLNVPLAYSAYMHTPSVIFFVHIPPSHQQFYCCEWWVFSFCWLYPCLTICLANHPIYHP